MEKSPIVEKSFEFAVRVVLGVRELRRKGCERELLSQLLRSGTSIGANVSEAQSAQSRNDFIAKMNIALKEAMETRYWLRLLKAVGTTSAEMDDLQLKSEELIRMLVKIVKTTRETQKQL